MVHQYTQKLKTLIGKKLPRTLRQSSRSYIFLFIPILAIVLFTAAMALILWTLNYQNKNQQEYTLFRETAYAKQRIQLRFNSNEDALLELTREISNSVNQMRYPESFLKGATRLIQDSPEILHLRWIDRDKNKLWSMPNAPNHTEWYEKATVKNKLDKELAKTYLEMAETGKATYGNIINLDLDPDDNRSADRKYTFWHLTPVIQGGNLMGGIAVLYSARGIVRHMIPSDLSGLYRFTLNDTNGLELAVSNPKKTAARSLEHDIQIDRPASPLILHVSSYPPPTNLTYRTLLWLVIGLSMFVLWSLWSVWRQTRERYLVQLDLQKETAFRRAMEESMTIGIRAHDMAGKITYVNPAFCNMTGWNSDELIGMPPPFPFWPEEYVPDLNRKLRMALSGEAPSSGLEAVMQRKDKTRINTRTFVAPLIDDKGHQTGWISSIVDISEPIKVRQQLALAHERFTTVLGSLDASVSVIALQSGQLLFANKYYREHFGESTQAHLELAGHEIEPTDLDDLNIDSVDGFAGLPASELTPGKADSREVELTQSKQWFEVRRRYISWVDGHLAQLIVATDISARKHAEDLTRQQEEQMQFTSRLTTMGEMASSLAHELNQPLAAISNYCTGVANRLKSSKQPDIEKDILPAIEKATSQAHRAGTIISRIKSFVKRSQPQNQWVDIRQIIEDSTGLADIEAARYNVRIKTVIHESVEKSYLDPVLIQQVIVNLLKNAIDAVRQLTDPGKKVIELVIDYHHHNEQKMLRIRVFDQGPGISPDAVEKLYEPFFSTKPDGMGMGLNICRSIIESHHGRLWAENRTDPKDGSTAGCTFTILLPVN